MIDYGLMAEKVFDLTYFNGRIAVILGSGLGGFSNNLKNQCTIPYNDIPSYPLSTVEGHEGELVLGTLDKQELLIAKGRFHYYEGYSFHSYETLPLPTEKLSAKEIITLRDEAFNRYHNHKPFLQLIEKKFGKKAAENIIEMTKIKLKRKIKGDQLQ